LNEWRGYFCAAFCMHRHTALGCIICHIILHHTIYPILPRSNPRTLSHAANAVSLCVDTHRIALMHSALQRSVFDCRSIMQRVNWPACTRTPGHTRCDVCTWDPKRAAGSRIADRGSRTAHARARLGHGLGRTWTSGRLAGGPLCGCADSQCTWLRVLSECFQIVCASSSSSSFPLPSLTLPIHPTLAPVHRLTSILPVYPFPLL